jgi:hypothetical protein
VPVALMVMTVLVLGTVNIIAVSAGIDRFIYHFMISIIETLKHTCCVFMLDTMAKVHNTGHRMFSTNHSCPRQYTLKHISASRFERFTPGTKDASTY